MKKMDYGIHLIICLALMVGVLLVEGVPGAESIADKISDVIDFSNEDNYQNDEDESNGEPEVVGPLPTIKSKPLNLTVPEGRDVYLPCDMENSGGYPVMWKNGSKPIWLNGNWLMNADDRKTIFPNNTYLLRGVTVYDSTDFECSVAGTITVTHRLNVYKPISIFHFLPEVLPGQAKVVRKGDSLTLSCNATGSPSPTVTWYKRGRKHFPDGREKMTGVAIFFENVNRKHSGIYECEASNAFGSERRDIEIHVHYPPDIEIEEETITTGIGLQPEITCTVHAEPKATVTWYKNGNVVTKKDRISTTNVNNKYTLQITKMNEDDFGSYTCHAKNELGSDRKAVVLSGTPTKPKFKASMPKHARSDEIIWTVESYLPIIEYELQYKNLQDGKWTRKTPQSVMSTEGNLYTMKDALSELPPNKYMIRVRAKNSHGWSHYSEETISTEDNLQLNRGGALRSVCLIQIIVFFSALFM